MPYATRSGTIDFPKRKLIPERKTKRDQENATKETESPVKNTPTPKLSVTSVSSSARKALHSCNVIIGRDKELAIVTDFLNSHLDDQSSGSIYISGLPGTGKTACINYVIDKNQFNKKYQIIKINCTAFNSSKAVFKRICDELKLKNSTRNEKDAVAAIEGYLMRKHKIILMILDEIDQLESKSQAVLYKIFEWPSLQKSKFVLIGIANAMDLTDRNLPRLCVKVELKPILLHFAPYSKDEIAEILKKRLTEVGADSMFAPGALELISAKVAGTSGDVRRALDLGKRVIEIAEQNQAEINGSSKKSNLIKSLTEETSKSSPVKGPSHRTPKKLEVLVNAMIDSARSPPKRKLNFSQGSPKKALTESSQNVIGVNGEETRVGGDCEDGDGATLRKSPRKCPRIPAENLRTPEKRFLQGQKWSSVDDCGGEADGVRRSPRKLQFDVNSKDVLTVVKTVFGTKNFKASEESSFPLHQKLVICALLLMIKKGNKKDLNVGKLHQVYSRVCTRKGLTAVDKSGFIFLCRQIEVTGIIQVGKGQGTLAKVSLQWDESEVTNSLKDLNLLSSVLNDPSFLPS